MSERVVFGPAFEGLLRAVETKLDDAAVQRFREIGVDPTRLLPAYPLETWLSALQISAELLAPGASIEEGTYIAGRRMFEGYGTTLVGKALLGMLRVLGPRRALERMERNLRTANNYSTTSLRMLGPASYELTCSDVVHPHYYRGMFDVGLQAAGAKELDVTLVSHESGTATFRIEWKA